MMLNIFSCAYWPFVYFLRRNLYSDPLPFLSGLFVLLLSHKCSLYSPATGAISDICFATICPHSLCCLFTFSMLSFEAKKFLILMKYNLSFLSFFACAFGVISKNLLPNLRLLKFTPMFSSKSFIVLALTFRYISDPFNFVNFLLWLNTHKIYHLNYL